jgi:hypothetical protein
MTSNLPQQNSITNFLFSAKIASLTYAHATSPKNWKPNLESRARFSTRTAQAELVRHENEGRGKRKEKREALAPRRRRLADAGAAARSERLQDTFFTCQGLDQPLRSGRKKR